MNYEVVLRAKLAEIEGRKHAVQVERVADPIDYMHQVVECDREARLSDHDRTLVREIRAALDRIKDKAFGECEECMEPIRPKRLEAVPWARLCIECASREELMVKGRAVALAEE